MISELLNAPKMPEGTLIFLRQNKPVLLFDYDMYGDLTTIANTPEGVQEFARSIGLASEFESLWLDYDTQPAGPKDWSYIFLEA